jgi:hypothetical protein
LDSLQVLAVPLGQCIALRGGLLFRPHFSLTERIKQTTYANGELQRDQYRQKRADVWGC